MKQTEQNEMDLLLRSLAKGSRSISDIQNKDTAHLDADELNAFAERTVPPAARARYTAHIADCSRCRKLVADLTAAAGLPITESKHEDRAQTSLWQRLPAFLSPGVLRFAVPALALLAVITVGIITFRQQQSADFVAQNQEPAAPQSTAQAPQEASSPENQAIQGQITTQSSPVPSQTSGPVERQAKAGEKAAVTDQTTSVDSTSVFHAKDASKPDAAKADESKPTFAPEPAPPAAARPQSSPEANKNEAVAKQKENAAGDTATRISRDGQQAVEEREADLSRSRKAAESGRGGALSSTQARRSETKLKRADQDGEIREVAGRRFQRQGNTWIDVDYDSARPAMTVVRGSEQYRVLVADEPGIRTIAERLAGEVIVVWKGRAYRIR